MDLALDREFCLENHSYYYEYEDDECISTGYDYFDYYGGWKWCNCHRCTEKEAYCKLDEENEKHEEMFFDDLVYRFLEKDDEEELGLHYEKS